MTTETLNSNELLNFTGSKTWYRHPMARSILYTDGVQYVAESGGAYWLLDEIVFAQYQPKIAREEFQKWTLAVQDSSAILNCEDGNGYEVFKKTIPYTDFPLASITFFFINNVILLPSEN